MFGCCFVWLIPLKKSGHCCWSILGWCGRKSACWDTEWCSNTQQNSCALPRTAHLPVSSFTHKNPPPYYLPTRILTNTPCIIFFLPRILFFILSYPICNTLGSATSSDSDTHKLIWCELHHDILMFMKTKAHVLNPINSTYFI